MMKITQSLCSAIESRDTEEALRLIGDGICIYKKGKGGETPLYFALMFDAEKIANVLSKCYERDMRVVWAGRKEVQPILVAHGRYQIARTRDMADAMSLNTESDFETSIVPGVEEERQVYSTEKVLLYHNKYPEVVTVTFRKADLQFRKELMNNGLLDVNHRSQREQTYLHLAAVRGYTDVFKKMLKLGTNATLKDICGDTCLFLAVLTGRNEIANKLLQLPNVDARQCNDKGMSLIAAAAQSGNIPLFNEVLNKAVQMVMKERHKELSDYAAAAKVTHELLAADDNLIHMESNLAMVAHLVNLYLPEKYTDIAFSLMIKFNNFLLVKKLIKGGADVFRPLPPHDHNALYIAADNGSLESMEEIVKQYPPGAFSKNEHGCVEALHRAIYCKHHSVAERLLDLGIDPNANDQSLGYSYNAVHLCAYWNDVKMIKSLIKRGADLKRLDTDSHQTALGIALNKGHKDIVRELKYSIKHKV